MYVHNVSPRRKLWNELSSFGGTEKRDAGITSVQLSSQSDCTWQGRATKHEFKAATKHNRHCKTQRGQLSLFFFASFKTTTLCVGVRSCSFWVTATDNGRCHGRRVGGNNATDNRGSVISPGPLTDSTWRRHLAGSEPARDTTERWQEPSMAGNKREKPV